MTFIPVVNSNGHVPLFCNIINELAKQKLCNEAAIDAMTPEELDRHIAEVIKWTDSHADKSETELLIISVKQAMIDDKTRWYDIDDYAEATGETRSQSRGPAVSAVS